MFSKIRGVVENGHIWLSVDETMRVVDDDLFIVNVMCKN